MTRLIDESCGRGISPGDSPVVTRIVAPPDRLMACRVHGNPLAPDWTWPDVPDVERIVTWSGSLGGALFDGHPFNWGASGRRALDEWCAAAAARLNANGMRVLFQPHARHVLSDVPSTQRFLSDHEDDPFGIVLAPASLLEPSMLEHVEDHLERIFEGLAGRCAMLLLEDAARSDDGRMVDPVPPGQGVLPGGLIRDLMERWLPGEAGIVVSGVSGAEYDAWLAGVVESSPMQSNGGSS